MHTHTHAHALAHARTHSHTHTHTHTALLSSLATHTQQTCSTHNRQQTHNLRLAKQGMAQTLALAGIAGIAGIAEPL